MRHWTATALLALALIPAQSDCDGENGGGGRGPYFANCEEAERAGAAPMDEDRAGSGYRRELDHDGDGLACEGLSRQP